MAQGQATKVKKKKKSVLKRAAQSYQRAEVNRANRTRVRSAIKKMRIAIGAGDATAAANLLQPTMSAIDQAITKNVLHENTANRYKSRLTLAFNGLKAKTSRRAFAIAPRHCAEDDRENRAPARAGAKRACLPFPTRSRRALKLPSAKHLHGE